MSTSELSSFDEPTFRRELLVVASFLAGYGASTRTGYATDLRLFAEWCRTNGLDLFEVQRSHLELFGRSMEARGLACVATRSVESSRHAIFASRRRRRWASMFRRPSS